MAEANKLRVGVVLFEGFELLDVFGPLEMFGVLSDRFEIVLLGPESGPVPSAQGPEVVAEVAYRDAGACDIALVPGGRGTRPLALDPSFLSWLSTWAQRATYICAVCTGSGLLGAAGLLDGYRATSNKLSFAWASTQGRDVTWLPEARWVEDHNRWTSAGVAAGIDMTLALIAHIDGMDVANELADHVEYDWHREPTWDPFAAKAGLVARRESTADRDAARR
jgi:transcriptional regulator GlxA family with amidase domain